MVWRQRSERVITLLEREAEIVEVMREKEACSSLEVDAMIKYPDLLTTMRTIHAMEAKGLLERVNVNGRKLFRLKRYNQRIKVARRQPDPNLN